MKTNPSNHTPAPAPDGWQLTESTHEYDGQGRLIRTHAVQSRNHPAPQEDPAWARQRLPEGAGFVKRIEHQHDAAGRVSKLRVWTNHPPA